MSGVDTLMPHLPGSDVGPREAREMFRILRRLRDGAEDRNDFWSFMAFAMPRANRSSSQLFQDLWALWMCDSRRCGYFVEFGATDGRNMSNTWMLERDMGWSGVVAEPNPVYAEALGRNRSCAVSTRCVHSESGLTLDFFATKQPEFSRLSIIAAGDGHEERKRKSGRLVPVQTVSLNDLLLEHQAPAHIDYLSVDTEGSEYEILRALDFDRWRPRTITVEHNFTDLREPLFELLAGHGYRRMWTEFSRFDDWYVWGG